MDKVNNDCVHPDFDLPFPVTVWHDDDLLNLTGHRESGWIGFDEQGEPVSGIDLDNTMECDTMLKWLAVQEKNAEHWRDRMYAAFRLHLNGEKNEGAKHNLRCAKVANLKKEPITLDEARRMIGPEREDIQGWIDASEWGYLVLDDEAETKEGAK